MTALFPNAHSRNSAPYRNDIVGSFLRPEALKLARAQFEAAEIDAQQLREVVKEAVKNLVQLQKAHGLHAVSDGEFSRAWWHLDFLAGLEGVEWIDTNAFPVAFKGVMPKSKSVKIVDKIAFPSTHPFIDAYQILHEAAAGTPTKFTIPSPAMLHVICCLRADDYQALPRYQNEQVLFDDIAQAYIDAMHHFHRLGLRNLQLDDTSWGQFCDPKKRDEFSARGFDLDKIAHDYVALINRIVDAKPQDMALTMHICRGNFRSHWFSEGGYEPIAQTLFGNCRVDGFFLEYDSDRAGDFKPLRFIQNQQVVLGLISSKTGELENKQAVIERIKEAAEIVPISQLCLSPQCGFASTEEGNVLSEAAQWQKLDLIADIAAEVWGK